MIKKLLNSLRKLADPRGPGSVVLSTDSHFTGARGLPYSVGLRQRAELAPLSHEQVQRACAPERYYAKEEIEVPYSRERTVSPYILERYLPVLQGMEIAGWRVTQEPRSQFCDCTVAHWAKSDGTFIHHACGRRRAPLTDEQVIEKALTVQMQPGDRQYEQYALTIPGKDKAVVDGVPVKGGTWINSRKHYKELTKDMVLWDSGVPKAREKAWEEQKQKRKAGLNQVIEERAHRLISDRPGDL